jgi:hypothetical protein
VPNRRPPSINQIPETQIASNPASLTSASPIEDDEVPSNWYVFDSSRIEEAAYDPDSSRLYVRFVKPHGTGTPWTYEGVPPNIWANLKRSQSPGKFVNRVLNQFDYHRGRWD